MKNQIFKEYGSNYNAFQKDVTHYENLGWILTSYHLNEGKDIRATFLKPSNGGI